MIQNLSLPDNWVLTLTPEQELLLSQPTGVLLLNKTLVIKLPIKPVDWRLLDFNQSDLICVQFGEMDIKDFLSLPEKL